MPDTIRFILIGILIGIAIMVFFFCRARKRWKENVTAIQQKAEDDVKKTIEDTTIKIKKVREKAKQDILEEKERSKRALIAQREAIEADKEKLSNLTDKELMIQAILALDGYASRMGRIEDTLLTVDSNNQRRTDEIQTLIGAIQKAAESGFEGTNDSINDLGASLSKIANEIYDVDSTLSALKENIDEDGNSSPSLLSDISDDLSDVSDDINSLKSTLSEIQGYSSFGTLSEIYDKLDSIESSLNSLNN